MKTITAGLLAHYQGEATMIATCWKVTRIDGTVFGFTDHDANLTVSGVTYAASTGYSRTAIQTSAQLNVDNMDVEGILDAASITETDLAAGLWDYAAIEVFEVNWADLTLGTLKQRKGTLGEVRSGRIRFSAELRGMMQRMQQAIGRMYGPACDVDLGSARCGIVLASFTVTGSITGVTGNRVFADSGRAEADGYFDGGKITFTSGANNGRSVEVKSYLLAGGAIALQVPAPYTVAIGNTYSMSAGCDKTFGATGCGKFNNKVNFQGFPHLPGRDRLVNGGL